MVQDANLVLLTERTNLIKTLQATRTFMYSILQLLLADGMEPRLHL